MKKLILFLFIFSLSLQLAAQLVKLEPVSSHYKSLQQFSDQKNSSRAWMDTVRFPASEYGSSIVYLLVKPFYLNEAEIKSISESVRFPANSSDQVRQELDYLLQLQEVRTPEQVPRVQYLGDIGYWPSINLLPTHPQYQRNLNDLFFEAREVIGEHVNHINYPATSSLLKGVMQDMRIMEFTIKYNQLRPRPYHLEERLRPLAKMGSPAYASGHTMWAFLQAFIWSELIPETQENFLALAEEIRRSREIMGIHYPSDNEAARLVAYKMLQYYFTKDVFKRNLSEAKKEWEKKKGTASK